MISQEKNMCILTIDLEEWYHGAYPNYSYKTFDNKFERRLEKIIPKLLDLLGRYNYSATFFVLGEIAKDYPQIIKEIYRNGHEIASHGFSHIRANILGEKNFADDVKISVDIIANLTGKRPKGFRAPNFSLSPSKTPWAFKLLEDFGFEYDSSVFPAIMYYGGATKFSRYIAKIGRLEEYPPSCFSIMGIRISFSGGFYFRVLQKSIIKKGIQNYWNKNETPILYIHPKDIDPYTPKLPLNPIANFIHKGGCKKSFEKLIWLFNSCKCISINEFREKHGKETGKKETTKVKE